MKTKVYKLDFYKKAEDIFELYKDQPMAMFLDSLWRINWGVIQSSVFIHI